MQPGAAVLDTPTLSQQRELERVVAEQYSDLLPLEPQEREQCLVLLRERHARYLQGGLGALPAGFAALGVSRPWLCYWMLHGLALLGQPLPRSLNEEDVVTFLSACQHSDGGYSGGTPGQLSHLAPTYAGARCDCEPPPCPAGSCMCCLGMPRKHNCPLPSNPSAPALHNCSPSAAAAPNSRPTPLLHTQPSVRS